jgi:hypothetical protein
MPSYPDLSGYVKWSEIDGYIIDNLSLSRVGNTIYLYFGNSRCGQVDIPSNSTE